MFADNSWLAAFIYGALTTALLLILIGLWRVYG